MGPKTVLLTCLAVGDDGDVVPLEEGLEHGARRQLVEPPLRDLRPEDVVVGEATLAHACVEGSIDQLGCWWR